MLAREFAGNVTQRPKDGLSRNPGRAGDTTVFVSRTGAPIQAGAPESRSQRTYSAIACWWGVGRHPNSSSSRLELLTRHTPPRMCKGCT